MSCTTNKDNFPKLFASVLRRRLYPNTGMQRKVLAAALGVSPESVNNWLSGNNEPSASTLAALISFLDPGFVSELFGGTVVKLPSPQAAEALEVMREAHATFMTAMGGRP